MSTNSILIGNKIKPRNKPTRTEHIHGHPYVFAEVHKDGHFIAEVSNADHAELMLSQPAHFYLYQTEQARLTRGKADSDAEAEQKRLEAIEKNASDAKDAEDLRLKAEAEEKAAAERAEAEAAANAQRNADLASAVSDATPEAMDEAKAFLALDVKKMSNATQKFSGLPAVKLALALEVGGQNRPAVAKVLNDVLALAAGAGSPTT